jgi:hypothetical protein
VAARKRSVGTHNLIYGALICQIYPLTLEKSLFYVVSPYLMRINAPWGKASAGTAILRELSEGIMCTNWVPVA